MNSLSFYPFIPINLLLILIFFSIIVIFIGFKLKAPGNIFRSILICLVILSIANPTIVSENKENIPDTVAVILDLSPSQNINDRKDIAQNTYNDIKNKLEKLQNLDIRLKTIYGENGSKIFEPLSSMIGDISADKLAGAIIISDGQIKDSPSILNNYNGSYKITICDVMGNQISSNTILDNNKIIDVSSYKNGLYFIRAILSDGTLINKRLIIKH